MEKINWERNPDANYPNVGTDEKKADVYRNDLPKALREGLDEFLERSVPCTINDTGWKIHPNVNVYLDITTQCPFDCKFCIAKVHGRSHQQVELDRVKECIGILENSGIYFTTQITGGEPTLHRNIEAIIKTCAGHKRVINTNFPLSVTTKCDHINVSCHHYNANIETEIMGRKRNRALLHNMDECTRSKIRLQCNLIGGYIDTYGEIMQYIAWGYHKLGVKSFAFSFLTALPRENIYEQSIIDYVQERPTYSFGDVMECLRTTTHWEFLKYRGGVACYYEVWRYKAYEFPVTVVFKYSDNHILHSLDEMDGYIPDIILHPTGELTASWNKGIKRLI